MTAALASRPVFTGPMGQRDLVSYVDPYPGAKNSDRLYGKDVAPCIRCGGSGIYSQYHGVCYRCWGRGSEANGVSVGTLRKYAKAEAYYRDHAEEYAAFQAAEDAAEQAAHLAIEVANDHALALAINARRDAAASGYLAEVGEKVAGIEISVKVAKFIAGSYNRSSGMFIIAEAASGHAIKFFGSAQSVMQLEKGDKAILNGKVKAHEVYDGIDQSVLSYVKVEIIDDADKDLDEEE